jgi:hypothetical protein
VALDDDVVVEAEDVEVVGVEDEDEVEIVEDVGEVVLADEVVTDEDTVLEELDAVVVVEEVFTDKAAKAPITITTITTTMTARPAMRLIANRSLDLRVDSIWRRGDYLGLKSL